MMMPVRSFETSSGARPLSAMAWSIATWFQAAAAAEKAHRPAVDHLFGNERWSAVHLRAKPELGVFLGAGHPRSGVVQTAVTSWVFEPIEDTMPIPVTTTRLIRAFSILRRIDRQLSSQAGAAGLNRPTRISLMSYMRLPSASSHPSEMPRTSLPLKTRFISTP